MLTGSRDRECAVIGSVGNVEYRQADRYTRHHKVLVACDVSIPNLLDPNDWTWAFGL